MTNDISTRLDGRVTAISGGAKGIGLDTARVLGKAGAKVWVCDIDEDLGRNNVENLRKSGIDSDFCKVDLMKPGHPQRMIDQIVETDGKIDILINNAKSGVRLGLLDETEENWDNTTLVMQRGAFFASQQAIRRMKDTGGGSIINISSIAALYTCHESPSYHAAKAAITQLTRYMAQKAGLYGVRVNCVLPGFIVKDEDRGRYDRSDNVEYRTIAEFAHPLGRVGASHEVVNAILFLVSDQASFITGQSLVVDGGLTGQEPFEKIFEFAGRET